VTTDICSVHKSLEVGEVSAKVIFLPMNFNEKSKIKVELAHVKVNNRRM
jgi:hypothetical protein